MTENKSKTTKRKRRNGDGTTYKYKGGYRTVITRRGMKPITAMGRSEQESRRLAKEKLAQAPIYNGSLVPGSENILFGDFIQSWLNLKHRKLVTETTYRRYESLTRLHIVPSLGNMKLRNITKNHINSFLEKMNDEGQSTRSCQQTRALLSAAFKRAMQDDLISVNPVTQSRNIKSESPQIHPFSQEEVKTLLEVTKDAYMQARIRIAVLYGLRQGEALGLKWADVDLDKGEIFIWQQMQKVSGNYKLVKLKSKFSVRTLELNSSTINALRAHKREQNQTRLALGASWEDNDLVFPGLKGQPQNSHTDFNHWQKALAAAKLPTKRLHDARHTCATLLYDQGMDIETIRRFLGHASVLLTSRTYVHHSARQMRGAASALSSLGF